MSVSIVQCPLPSLKKKRPADLSRASTVRQSHVEQAFPKRDWLQHRIVVRCWVCAVASELDWFPHSDQTSLLDQSEDSITSFLDKQNPFCMDDLYVQCYWICRICHCFCCKCLTLGFDITARSSGLLKRCQIPEIINGGHLCWTTISVSWNWKTPRVSLASM